MPSGLASRPSRRSSSEVDQATPRWRPKSTSRYLGVADLRPQPPIEPDDVAGRLEICERRRARQVVLRVAQQRQYVVSTEAPLDNDTVDQLVFDQFPDADAVVRAYVTDAAHAARVETIVAGGLGCSDTSPWGAVAPACETPARDVSAASLIVVRFTASSEGVGHDLHDFGADRQAFGAP